jgi:maleamate amidohydrolase
MRTALTLEPKSAALLLVDLQEEQRQDPLYAVSGFEHVLTNAAQLLYAARMEKLLVVHAAYRRDFLLRPPRPFEPMSAAGDPAFSDAANPLTAICHEVEPGPFETVIHKNDASAFCEGTLLPILADRKIEWLVIAGVWSEACVAATVRDAIAAGFRVLLVKDACGSGTIAMHETAVLNIANRLYGGAVADTHRALNLIEGRQAEAWIAERPVPILYNSSDISTHYAAL